MADDIVKSVGRVFEVLELFSKSQQPLSATQVERQLDYPQSSTLALLKSLVKLGYLSFDCIEKSYFPTIRIAQLGKSLETSRFGNAELSTLMEHVSERTGESVTLTCQNDLRMQFLQIVSGRRPVRLNVKAGDSAPLFQSSIGIAALADQADDDIARLVHRFNRRAESDKVDLPAIMQHISTVREIGYAILSEAYVHGVGAIAWSLPGDVGSQPIVFSVAGPYENIIADADYIVDVVQSAFELHLA